MDRLWYNIQQLKSQDTHTKDARTLSYVRKGPVSSSFAVYSVQVNTNTR